MKKEYVKFAMKLYMRLLLHLTSTALAGWFLLGIRKGVRIIMVCHSDIPQEGPHQLGHGETHRFWAGRLVLLLAFGVCIAQQELQWHFHVWTMRIFMLTFADRSTPARESIFVT